jgi:hypothetical protein
MAMGDMSRAWLRRPSLAVARLRGRGLLVLSARDLLRAAGEENALLVALVAPSPAAVHGFARAARDAAAPLLLARPSGAADEKGPEEARDDAAFVEAAFDAAAEVHLTGPLALLKEPPRAGSATPERERVQRELETGFTGVALATEPDSAPAARDAALAAAQACQRELGLEVVPLGGSIELGVELVRQLASRGAAPSALRVPDEDAAEAARPHVGGVALSVASEIAPRELVGRGIRQLVASGPFLRALQRAAPREVLEQLESWADERGATIEQAAARHQRMLRDLPQHIQLKLEALCCFEAQELYARAGVRDSAGPVAERVGSLAKDE